MDDELVSMIHHPDHDTSIAAAVKVIPKLTILQGKVLAALRKRPMTDEELESLPEFSGWAPSTARKRRSELYQAGLVVKAGKKRNSYNNYMTVWKVKDAV